MRRQRVHCHRCGALMSVQRRPKLGANPWAGLEASCVCGARVYDERIRELLPADFKVKSPPGACAVVGCHRPRREVTHPLKEPWLSPYCSDRHRRKSAQMAYRQRKREQRQLEAA